MQTEERVNSVKSCSNDLQREENGKKAQKQQQAGDCT
jgi:hypothetical protein